MKELSDWAEFRICFRKHRTLLKIVFMTRLDHVLIEKRACAGSAVWGLFWDLSLYLDIPEQVGRNQRSGKYSKKVCRWIPCTWNGEILSIFELPLGFSVAKVG